MTQQGQKQGVSTGVYTQFLLTKVYDNVALKFNMRYLWGCPTDSVLLPFFRDNFTTNHLDCGVATGYFPAAALETRVQEEQTQQLALLDLNPNSLQVAKTRISSQAPVCKIVTIPADVTGPVPGALQSTKFDSISAFNLFHCIPRREKLRAFALFAALLDDDGTLVGCTVLGGAESHSWYTTLALRIYNGLGVFNNWDDQHAEFRQALDEEFAEVETFVVGTMLLFKARKPRRGDNPKTSAGKS